ncbi:MAG: helix-turn-helix domain-containing protein [Peptostreptococcus anaerobius]
MSVDMDIIYYIAENVKSNIRELEGALNTVSFYASIAGRKIDLDTAREALKNQIISYNTKETNILRIKETVADAYNVTVEELDSKKRSKNIAFPRQVAMYLARNLLDKSLPKIGEEFGGRDHTTVMHAIKRIEDEIEKDDMTRMRIEKITSDLNG